MHSDIKNIMLAPSWHYPKTVNGMYPACHQKKNKSVEQEMRFDCWNNALRNKITNTIQLQEFVILWIKSKKARHNHLEVDCSLGISHTIQRMILPLLQFLFVGGGSRFVGVAGYRAAPTNSFSRKL